ncbi:MAG: hypothetical protein MUO77_21275 [Anaerolineales bacterium]|nr:hypothetical protein [Anaerolineales bacterium]
MNNDLTALNLLLKNDSFSFSPQSCRDANVSLIEAKFLRWLFIKERISDDIFQNFTMGIAFKLRRQGFVDNPLKEQGDTYTNIWKLTDDVLEILKTITGVKA